MGAFERLGIFPTSDELYEECCDAFWVGFVFLISRFFFSFAGFFFRGGVWYRHAIYTLAVVPLLLSFSNYMDGRIIEIQLHQKDDAARLGAHFGRAFLPT